MPQERLEISQCGAAYTLGGCSFIQAHGVPWSPTYAVGRLGGAITRTILQYFHVHEWPVFVKAWPELFVTANRTLVWQDEWSLAYRYQSMLALPKPLVVASRRQHVPNYQILQSPSRNVMEEAINSNDDRTSQPLTDFSTRNVRERLILNHSIKMTEAQKRRIVELEHRKRVGACCIFIFIILYPHRLLS